MLYFFKVSKNYCDNCGQKLEPDDKFCENCGLQLDESASHHHRPKKSASALFNYPKGKRRSEIIVDDKVSGEPVVLFRNLHPNAVWLFFFEYLGKSSILLVLFLLTVLIEPLITVLIVTVYFIILILIAETNYKNFEFEISEMAFRIQYGVFHKYSVNIAFDQIQNINIRRSVIDQILGLSHIEIETAGTGGGVQKNIGGLKTYSEGYIPGVSPEEAADVKVLMLARMKPEF